MTLNIKNLGFPILILITAITISTHGSTYNRDSSSNNDDVTVVEKGGLSEAYWGCDSTVVVGNKVVMGPMWYRSEGTSILIIDPEKLIAETQKIKLGELIGVVGGFDGDEIIVSGKYGIGSKASMGRMVIVEVDAEKGQYIYMKSTFPMMTDIKCKVINAGDRKLIKKGMKVYLKP